MRYRIVNNKVKRKPGNQSNIKLTDLTVAEKIRQSKIEVEPFSDVQTTTALTSGGSDAFSGGVLLPDGRVFCIARSASNGKIYDPVTNTQTTTALTSGGSDAFYGGVLLSDGRVFCVPLSASNAKIYDPVTNTQSTTALTSGGTNAFVGGVLLPDGRVFCVPFGASNGKILSGPWISSVNRWQLPPLLAMSAFYNKL
jgi:hypothetical protein